jgi:hypothetical protein
MSYAPGATIGIQRTTDPTAVTHTDSAATINFRLGAYLDLFGIGANYGYFAARVTRSASGLPANLNASGNYLRFDLDLPLRFGPEKSFLVRASYAHESIDSANGPNQHYHASGSGNAAGLTLAALSKDISLNVLVGKIAFATNDRMSTAGYPDVSFESYNIDVGLTIRWIPTGTLIQHYTNDVSMPDVPLVGSTCGWDFGAGGGYVCRENSRAGRAARGRLREPRRRSPRHQQLYGPVHDQCQVRREEHDVHADRERGDGHARGSGRYRERRVSRRWQPVRWTVHVQGREQLQPGRLQRVCSGWISGHRDDRR